MFSSLIPKSLVFVDIRVLMFIRYDVSISIDFLIRIFEACPRAGLERNLEFHR